MIQSPVPPDYRLPRSRRLLREADFARVFQQATRSTNTYVTVLCRPNGLLQPRLGQAISRRRVPRAVDRNRLRRLVRESFRHHWPSLVGLDVVVLPRRPLDPSEIPALLRELDRHWSVMSRGRAHEPGV